ncbi:MAG TPA: DHA2 family efflux MFS transporter permease subunit [Hyphomicrobiaceae bacterium]|nr:DHA2 family efflux MFS transporter permease subunit [Hyphomicrobiaceae bacterium]
MSGKYSGAKRVIRYGATDMAGASAVEAPGAGDLTVTQRALVLIVVTLATTIYTATVLISSALLPQLQGALNATQDEVSWVMTFNILATAVATPATGYLAARFGRRTTMLWGAGLFAASTFMCGASNSLEELIFWRIVQGAAGAPLIPLGQTILLDTFPARQHGMVIAVFGMANMIGPAIGPLFAGEIAEAFGWRWGFWMVLPVAFVTCAGLAIILERDRVGLKPRLDWTGFLTLSIAVAAAQLVVSRGQRLDWFDSSEIVIATFVAVLALYLFVVHSLTAERPFIRLGLLRDRNYALGLMLVTSFGMLNFAPIVLLPPLLQTHAGFPDSAIGEIVSWRGIGAGIGFFVAMLMGRIDPRITLTLGGLMQTAAGLWLMTFNLTTGLDEINLNSALQGIAVGFAWVPMTVITFATLPSADRPEAMSMFHLLRNFGSSLFISVAVAEVVRASGVNYARLAEYVSVYNPSFDMPWVSGAWSIESVTGLARLSREMTRQAAMMGYGNAFLLYTIVSAAVLPLCFFARMPRTAGSSR